jgi:hypothetical protein
MSEPKTVYDLIKTSPYFLRLKHIFPGMVETSKKTRIIPWKDEFAIADKNPEIAEELYKLSKQLEEGLITEEEYVSKSKELTKDVGSVSRTLGISFCSEGVVSFRDYNPDIATILHELGHIHFDANDYEWSSAYGGAEVLMWLGLEGRYGIREENVWNYIHYFRKAEEDPDVIGKEMAKAIIKKYGYKIVHSLYPLFVFAGILPRSVTENVTKVVGRENFEMLYSNLEHLLWLKIPHTKEVVRDFLTETLSGLRWNDSVFVTYARALELIL